MLAYDPTTNPLNQIEWAFGALECIHIASFAIAIGSIAIVDFRLLRFGLTNLKPSDLIRTTTFWTLGGLTTAITSGLLLFSTDPERYSANEVFRLKLICLIAAIIYNYTVHRIVAQRGSSGAGVIAGAVSILLWVPVIFGGLFYAFT